MGELYGIQIRYYVEVNFEGFERIVDALGGVTVNVQVPVVDDRYPAGGGAVQRVYIASGMQHMSGAEALVYARSRHGSTDFDRGARQQRVLLSLRQQTDVARILPKVDELASALSASVRTDIPRELLPQLLGLAAQVDTPDIRSYIFTPKVYQTEFLESPRGYIIVPRVDRIRAAVRDAFAADPGVADRREQLGEEDASVYVLNGSGVSGQASRIADYLEYLGMSASAPGPEAGRERPRRDDPARLQRGGDHDAADGRHARGPVRCHRGARGRRGCHRGRRDRDRQRARRR